MLYARTQAQSIAALDQIVSRNAERLGDLERLVRSINEATRNDVLAHAKRLGDLETLVFLQAQLVHGLSDHDAPGPLPANVSSFPGI